MYIMQKERIVYQSVDDLIPYANNPRNNDDAVEAVENSIKEFGFKVPIVVDENNIIVAGHTRLKASVNLGIEEVPTIIAKGLTDEQVKAFRLADNKTGELAEWDWKALAEEMNDINFIDMEEFGFGEAMPDIDIDDMFQEVEQEEDDGKDYLKWSNNKVETDEVDIEIMDNKLYEYESLKLDISFVRWLTGEE